MKDLYQAFQDHFEILSADTRERRDAAYALRYQVYCVENGFEDPELHRDGREHDEFDGRSLHVLVRHRASGAYAGTARLVLPPRRDRSAPFPIEQACQGHFYGHYEQIRGWVPRDSLAEVSRFAVSKTFKRRASEAESPSGASREAVYFDAPSHPKLHRLMPEITIGLIVALIRASLAHGVWHWYALMEPALLRLLLRFGVRFRPIGGRIDHHGIRQPAFAGAYELLHEIRENRPDLWEFLTDRGHLALLPEWEKPLNSPFGWVPGLSEEPRDPGSQDFQSLA